MKRKITFLCLFLTLNGCAFTAIGRDHILSLESNAPPEISRAATINCSGTIYSFMLSLIIPLPPIIPGFVFGGDSAGFSFEKELIEKNDIVKIEIRKPDGVVVFDSRIGYLYHDYGDIFTYKCSELDQLFLIMKTSNDKEYVSHLHYTKGKLEFDWGYLSQ